MTLRAQSLSCRRGDKLLFQDLSFDLAPAGALVLRGRNGAGKSSLLRICAGFLNPSAGSLVWRDAPIHEDPDLYRRHLSYIGHLDGLKSALTVSENLNDWGRILEPAATDLPDRIATALDQFRISHLTATPVRYLSAGQKKRTALCRLLLRDCPLWLLDEATVSLDDDGIDCLGAAIADHRNNGGMVMAATHIDLPIGDSEVITITPAKQSDDIRDAAQGWS